MTMLSTSDFELTVVPSEDITSFGMAEHDIFSSESLSAHYLLTPKVIAEMELRFGQTARQFLDDHAHLAATHCLRVRRDEQVLTDDRDRDPVEVISTLISEIGADPSPEAEAALHRLKTSTPQRFHSIQFPQRFRDDKAGTDRFVFRRLIIIRTENPSDPT